MLLDGDPSAIQRSRHGSARAFGADMNTHQVTLNGQVVAVGRDHFKLLTMVRSLDHHDEDGKKVTAHELVMEGVDAFGTVATKFNPPVLLKI